MENSTDIPEEPMLVVRAWAKARAGSRLPPIGFAASEIPPRLLPMSMCYRRMPDGSYIYSLVGDELAELLLEDPRGTVVLHLASDGERRARYDVIDKAVDHGKPFWLATLSTLTDGTQIPVGRLGLPATNGERQVLLILYFLDTGSLPANAKFATFAKWDNDCLNWLSNFS
jgi:hypothetical protein